MANVKVSQVCVLLGRSETGNIGTNNFREDEFNLRLVYYMLRLDRCLKTCTRGVKGFIRF